MSEIERRFANRTPFDFDPGDIQGLENVAAVLGDNVAPCNATPFDPEDGAQIRCAGAWSAEWGQRVGGYAHLPMLIREFGFEPTTMLDRVRLPNGALDDEDGWVPYSSLGRLLLECAHRTRCAHFGLLAGRMSCLSDLGDLGELVRNSASVGDALNVLTEHQHLDSEGGATYLAQVGDTVEIGYAVYHPDVIGSHQLISTALAANFNYLRELCGDGWVPSTVLLPLTKPSNVAPYRGIFRVSPRFDSEVGALRFPRVWMQRAVPGADTWRLRAARKRIQNARRADLLPRVYSTLRLMLLTGRHGGDDVADRLAVNRRTLNRRLRQRGTTFQEVLDTVRFTVARQLLSIDTIPLDDVAAALGYAGVSPFMRTFQRWAGTTPGRWRRAARSARLEVSPQTLKECGQPHSINASVPGEWRPHVRGQNAQRPSA